MRQYKTELCIIFILLFIWEAEFFILDIWPRLKVQAAEPPKVVINEIMWMGSSTSFRDEWIELKNMTSQNINLSGWTIEGATQSGGALVIPEDGIEHIIPANDFYLISYYSIADNLLKPKTVLNVIVDWKTNGISLANSNNGNLILKDKDEVIDSAKGDNWPAGEHKKSEGIYYSMERNSIPGDGMLQENWHTCLRATNLYPEVKDCATPKAENSIPPPEDTTPTIDYILINELLPSPAGKDEEEEFIELLNNGDTTTDLIECALQDQSGKKFTFEQGETISALSYQAFYTGKKISLNNNGDKISLICSGQILEPEVIYEKAPKNQSYNRQDDNTWAWSTTTTPGTKNEITRATEDPKIYPHTKNFGVGMYPRHIWINEFSPNPKGKDAENEFIEIYNPGPAEIDLTAWQIDDQENKGSHPHTFPENFIIKRGEYITLPYSQTKISLNNNDDWVRLLWPDGQAIDEVPYSDPPEGESYNKTNNGWRWSCAATPGEPNKIVSDDECAASPEEETENYSRALWINEFLPDPKGKDEEGEFIELQNRGGEEIDLTDWQIDDCENTGSRPHTFPENTKIQPDHYLTFYYKDTKISLNNNGDCVRLLNPAGQAVDEIKYGKAEEEQSYSRQNVDHWQWTDNPTPDKDNEFTQILAAENSITENNQPSATTPKRQILPQTGPNMYFYFYPLFLFFLFLFDKK